MKHCDQTDTIQYLLALLFHCSWESWNINQIIAMESCVSAEEVFKHAYLIQLELNAFTLIFHIHRFTKLTTGHFIRSKLMTSCIYFPELSSALGNVSTWNPFLCHPSLDLTAGILSTKGSSSTVNRISLPIGLHGFSKPLSAFHFLVLRSRYSPQLSVRGA